MQFYIGVVKPKTCVRAQGYRANAECRDKIIQHLTVINKLSLNLVKIRIRDRPQRRIGDLVIIHIRTILIDGQRDGGTDSSSDKIPGLIVNRGNN